MERVFTLNGRIMVKGLDVAAVADNGLIERIDGFFGALRQMPSPSQRIT